MPPAPLFAALLRVCASIYADLSLGAAVDTNLNHAPSGTQRQAAGIGDLSVMAGLDAERGSLDYWAEVGYDFTYYPAYSDFTSHAGTLSVGASLQLPHALSLRLSPFVSGQVYGDSARDSLSAGGSLALRLRPLHWLRASLRFSPSFRGARDDVFDATTWRGGAFIEVSPLDWLSVSAGYTLATSDVVLYSTTTSAGSTRGRGRRVSSFGSIEVATRARATIHALHASASAELPLGAYILVAYTGSGVELGTQSYVDHVVAARLGLLL